VETEEQSSSSSRLLCPTTVPGISNHTCTLVMIDNNTVHASIPVVLIGYPCRYSTQFYAFIRRINTQNQQILQILLLRIRLLRSLLFLRILLLNMDLANILSSSSSSSFSFYAFFFSSFSSSLSFSSNYTRSTSTSSTLTRNWLDVQPNLQQTSIDP
jgi:hypothetical protein